MCESSDTCILDVLPATYEFKNPDRVPPTLVVTGEFHLSKYGADQAAIKYNKIAKLIGKIEFGGSTFGSLYDNKTTENKEWFKFFKAFAA